MPRPLHPPALYPLGSIIFSYFEGRARDSKRDPHKSTLEEKIRWVLSQEMFDYEHFNNVTIRVEVVSIESWKHSFGVILDYVPDPACFSFLICFHSSSLLRFPHLEIFPFRLLGQQSPTCRANGLSKIRCPRRISSPKSIPI